jgi:hypothetical protein
MIRFYIETPLDIVMGTGFFYMVHLPILYAEFRGKGIFQIKSKQFLNKPSGSPSVQ